MRRIGAILVFIAIGALVSIPQAQTLEQAKSMLWDRLVEIIDGRDPVAYIRLQNETIKQMTRVIHSSTDTTLVSKLLAVGVDIRKGEKYHDQ